MCPASALESAPKSAASRLSVRGRNDDRQAAGTRSIERALPVWLAGSQAPVTARQTRQRAWTGESPSHFNAEDDLPVECVNWDDVQGALPRLAAMLPPGAQAVLPSEADWEYAERAGTETAYNVGDRLDRAHANFGAQIGKTCVVKRYVANAWGLFDCHGYPPGTCRPRLADWHRAVSRRRDGAGRQPLGRTGSDSVHVSARVRVASSTPISARSRRRQVPGRSYPDR